MKKQSAILCAALIATTSISYGATLTSLNKDQVKRAFTDKTVTVTASNQDNNQTSNGTLTSNTVYLDNNGHINGSMNNQGTMSSSQPQSDQGSYKIKNNGLLCFTWQSWHNAKEFCLNTYETTNAYIFVDDQHNFHAVAMKKDVQSGNQTGSTTGQTGQMNNNTNGTSTTTTTTPTTPTMPNNTNTNGTVNGNDSTYPSTPTNNDMNQ